VYSVAATRVEIDTNNKRHARRILAALVLIHVECVVLDPIDFYPIHPKLPLTVFNIT
jgi:hypothetical protein